MEFVSVPFLYSVKTYSGDHNCDCGCIHVCGSTAARMGEASHLPAREPYPCNHNARQTLRPPAKTPSPFGRTSGFCRRKQDSHFLIEEHYRCIQTEGRRERRTFAHFFIKLIVRPHSSTYHTRFRSGIKWAYKQGIMTSLQACETHLIHTAAALRIFTNNIPNQSILELCKWASWEHPGEGILYQKLIQLKQNARVMTITRILNDHCLTVINVYQPNPVIFLGHYRHPIIWNKNAPLSTLQ